MKLHSVLVVGFESFARAAQYKVNCISLTKRWQAYDLLYSAPLGSEKGHNGVSPSKWLKSYLAIVIPELQEKL